MSGRTVVTCARLREVVIEHCGIDPGELTPDRRLEDARISGFNLLRVVNALEDLYGIEFPVDLMAAIERVDDLVYFTETKIDQQSSGDRRW